MKKLLFIVLISCWSIVIMAGNVTPEEAMKQATNFVKERVAKGSRRAPSASAQLTMAKQVSGLYVINVGKNEGFVIVSPDDRTTSILGYADSGSLNPDNMPNNMRAWLQGYADEIAWAKHHDIQKSTTSKRAPSAVKTPIAPLVQTKWDQTAPYNNLCPVYSGSKKAATGCVATAMAQVMNYHQWPTAATTVIPGYSTAYNDQPCIPVSDLPAITFTWSDMQPIYSGSETDAQITAIATLMQYCGASVKMRYGSSSSSNTTMVATALKTYFDYNNTTTQFVSRSFYSYGDWIEMMYHELNNNRPIVYGGQSSGGGHEFVCDGYQGEDYFHINWGWGGMSDNYFKLSALDPEEQGTGGSSSTDGYHYGQDAIIGIQKSTESGEVLDITGTAPNLTLTSMTLSKSSCTVGETINITLNITNNNSSKDYDGDVVIGFKSGENYTLGPRKTVVIPKGGNRNDIVLQYTPSSAGTYDMVFFLPNGEGSLITNKTVYATLTVSGSSNPVSDEISVGGSIVVDNSGSLTFYGTTFKGTLTVENDNVSTDYRGWYEYGLQEHNGSSWSLIKYKSSEITIPANSSINIPFEFDGLTIGSKYRFRVTRYKSATEEWTSWQTVGQQYYISTAGIISYAADGTSTISSASGSNYEAPSGTLAVDLTGTTVTTVSGGATNCLFISDNDLTGATNFVKKTGDTYTAANISLTDGCDFYSPVDFTATNIEFTYNNDRWADGTTGWNTIILPFDVSSVTANGTAIDWFHSSTDTGKQFWLKEFTSDAVGVVNFGFADDMKANTPYIIALPGNHWGDAFDLSSKTIKFIGTNVEVKKSGKAIVTASNYRFVGNTLTDNTANIYCINATGNKFELKATGGSPAFRPFFKAGIFDPSLTSLSIGGDDDVTGIKNIKVGSDKNVYYDLNGRRVLYPKKGIYIMNGKKVIIK